MKKVIYGIGILLSMVSLSSVSAMSSLEGRWKLVGWTISNAVPIKDNLPVLNFKGDQMTGNTGCNVFSAKVVFKGDVMQASDIATSRRFCGDALDEQESAFIEALGQPLKVSRNANSLTLILPNNHMLNMRRSTVQKKK